MKALTLIALILLSSCSSRQIAYRVADKEPARYPRTVPPKVVRVALVTLVIGIAAGKAAYETIPDLRKKRNQ